MWFWRRFLRVPWIARRSNQWILKEVNPDHSAGILWPPDVRSQLSRKNPDAGKDWWHNEKGMTEDEMVGWRHWFKGHEFEQTPGDREGQGSLVCCSPWGRKESDTTEWTTTRKKMWRRLQKATVVKCWGKINVFHIKFSLGLALWLIVLSSPLMNVCWPLELWVVFEGVILKLPV